MPRRLNVLPRLQTWSSRALDWLAALAARLVLAWSAGRVDLWDRVWIETMQGRLGEIGDGRAQLRWSLGALHLVWETRRRRARQRPWPEAARIAMRGSLLGILALIAFTTHVPDPERMPAAVLFGFLALYFGGSGFLSGRRTGQIGTGAWAGVACGLAFTLAVWISLFSTAAAIGASNVAKLGGPDLVGIAFGAVGFFAAMGAGCGALGARVAMRERRRRA